MEVSQIEIWDWVFDKTMLLHGESLAAFEERCATLMSNDNVIEEAVKDILREIEMEAELEDERIQSYYESPQKRMRYSYYE